MKLDGLVGADLSALGGFHDGPPILLNFINRRYGGNLGVLWVDAHPDVLTPKDFAQGNAQVLGALLGRGDPDLVGEVDTPVKPSRVMYAGLDAWMPVEGEVINELGLRRAGSDAPLVGRVNAAG